MKVICFSGNLGNQIFYCAFKNYLENKYPGERVYRYVMRNCPAVKVDKYFNLDLPRENRWVNFISFIVFYLDIILKNYFRIKLPVSLVCGRGKIKEESIFFSNYLQDKYYYQNVSSDWLSVKMPETLTAEYKKYERLITETDSICIHIRRGDYVNPDSDYVDLSETDYYHHAIEYAIERYPNSKLFFFSDDLEYAREHFPHDNAYFVDCNRGVQSFLDIKLMSLAKINVIANSTFSYWAGYINHENKLVIYPKEWFRERTNRESPQIMLDSWIGLN